MPKKFVAFAVSLLVLVGTASCSRESTGDDKPVVLATFTIIADMGKNIAGDHLEVVSILPPGAEVHGYEPTPGDIGKAERADLILDNGLGLEAWFDRFVDTAQAEHVTVSEGVDTIPIEGHNGTANPHAWMSPTQALIYVDNIEKAFVELDPENAEDYRANAAAYREEIIDIRGELETFVEALPANHRLLVTCEGAFSYLARDAGLTEGYIWPVNSEQQSTPQQVARTIELVREHNVPAVFCESTVSDRSMKQVAEAGGSSFGGTLYVDSLSAPDGEVPTYLDLLRHDLAVITDALGGDK